MISSSPVQLVDPDSGVGRGPLDFLADEPSGEMGKWILSDEALEKWWSLGDVRNRVAMWIQGRKLSLPSNY